MPTVRSAVLPATPWFKVLLAAVALTSLLLALPRSAGAAGPIQRLDRWFVFGTNLAWFNGDYGSDLGDQVEGRWKCHFTPELCEKVFANLGKMGCPVVRIWAFEGEEGLKFTADLSTDPAYPWHEVTGLDPVFLANCRTLMDTAAKHRVKVYWTLLNHLIRDDMGGKHMRIITEPKIRDSYIRNAAVPFLKEFGQHPAFFAVDIINEAEGAIGKLDFLSGCGDPRKGCTWKQMRTFIKACADAFHAAVPGIKVTSTSGWKEEKNLKAGRFSGLGLDFYDWHSYRDNPVLPEARSLGLDRPVIIGECGPKTEEPDAKYSLQGRNWKAYLREAQGKGYAGLLTWSYGNPEQESNYTMVDKKHGWRSGARMIYASTRGGVIPDAGPLILTDGEKRALDAINEAMKPVLTAGGDPALSGWLSPQAPRIKWLAGVTGMYYPYLNPRYAAISLGRAAEEIAGLGNLELGGQNPDQARLASLQRIGSGILAPIAGSKNLNSIDGVKRLAAFLKEMAHGSPKATNSPFDGFIGAPVPGN